MPFETDLCSLLQGMNIENPARVSYFTNMIKLRNRTDTRTGERIPQDMQIPYLRHGAAWPVWTGKTI